MIAQLLPLHLRQPLLLLLGRAPWERRAALRRTRCRPLALLLHAAGPIWQRPGRHDAPVLRRHAGTQGGEGKGEVRSVLSMALAILPHHPPATHHPRALR